MLILKIKIDLLIENYRFGLEVKNNMELYYEYWS
jgi:hypothetical protein